jgi:low temperature requirement protein LtrA
VTRAWERLREPPRLRTLETEEDRRATWLELFFDLVFVVAIAELGTRLSGDVTLGGFLEFVALFVPVWWAWAGFTFYANRFDTDDLLYRLLVLAAMFGVAAMATNVHDVFEGDSGGFALSYVFVRSLLLVLYARVIHARPIHFAESARPVAILFFSAFSISVVLWLTSLAVPEPTRYWLWAFALTLEITAPMVGWRLIPGAPVDPRHLPERFGLMTIIVLGESVFAVVVGVARVSWELSSAAAAAGGFLAAVSIWWIYFGFLDVPRVFGRGIARGLAFTYSHFFVWAGIATLGVGVNLAIFSAAGNERYEDTAWVFCAGAAVCMSGLAAVQLVTPPALFDVDVALRLGTAVVAVVLLPVSFALPALLVVWILAGVLAAQVVFELAAHEEHLPAEGLEL